MNARPSLYARFGAIIAARDGNGFTCAYCGAPVIPPSIALTNPRYYEKYNIPLPGVVKGTLDHIVPQSSGGTDDFANLVIACQSCNNSKQSSELNLLRGVRHDR